MANVHFENSRRACHKPYKQQIYAYSCPKCVGVESQGHGAPEYGAMHEHKAHGEQVEPKQVNTSQWECKTHNRDDNQSL